MSTPPNTPPGYYTNPPQPPAKSNSSGCWKAGGITCGVLLLLMIVGGIITARMASKMFSGSGGFMGMVYKISGATKDGLTIQKSVVQYKAKTGNYPEALTDLVPDYLPNGKILHNEMDPVASPGHISWRYNKPQSGDPGNTSLLDLPYEMKMQIPGSKPVSQMTDIIITLDGHVGRSQGTARPISGYGQPTN